MKNFSMVVHQSLQQSLADYLRSRNLKTFMFSHLEEHSSHIGKDHYLSARDKVVGYVPQVRVEVILESNEIKSLLEDMRNADCTFKGKGIYWVTDLDEFGCL